MTKETIKKRAHTLTRTNWKLQPWLEIFITETDERLGEDGKRRFNSMLRRHSHHWKCAQQGWILSLALSEQISSSQRWAASLLPKSG
jgi:hypothetical protein